MSALAQPPPLLSVWDTPKFFEKSKVFFAKKCGRPYRKNPLPGLELSIGNRYSIALFSTFLLSNIDSYFFTIDIQPCPLPPCLKNVRTGQTPLTADVFYGRPLSLKKTHLYFFIQFKIRLCNAISNFLSIPVSGFPQLALARHQKVANPTR